MSSKVGVVGGGARKANNGINDIPSGSRKIVQSLKEIVNSPEAEIYVMLKECNMDPNEAVNRLLSQDPFHEVKSKKEKKKETRDIPDSRARGVSNMYNRGARGGSDRYAGRSGSTHFSSIDSGNFQGKSTNKKESVTPGHTGSWSSASRMAYHHQALHSDAVAMENKLPSVASGDGISSSQLAAAHQTAWFGAPGQRSMADIVKMGRPQNTTMKQNVYRRSELNHEHEASANQQVPVKDEWPSIEKPVAPSTSSMSVAAEDPEVFSGPSDFQSNKEDKLLEDRVENIHLAENLPSEFAGETLHKDESSEFDDNPYKYQMQNHPVEHHKDEDDVLSASANYQEPTVDSHDQEASHEEEDRPAVVIPDHLLIHTEECTQLSFGSFGSRRLSNNIEKTSDVAPQIEHSDSRNTEFYGDEGHGMMGNGNMVHAAATGNYDDSLESTLEVSKQENSETNEENRYTFAQSEPGYSYEDAKQQLNTVYASQTNAQNQMQNLASLSNMTGYIHSVPNTLLAETAQNARELDFQYSPFPTAQSMQLRNNNNASSLGAQSISMPEALRGSGIPATQPTQQTLPGIATGPALPQQLQMHPYSQPTLPLTHFANMIGYPLMPQNYPYLQSAYQQTFAGNSSYHQQVAAMVPQYKTNLSPGNMLQSATAPSSAYGYGNSANVGSVANFPLNQHSAPTATTLGYEDVLASQNKDSNHLVALQQQQQQHQQQQQQNENSAMLHHGHGSRTMSGIPANTYYNPQAQQPQQQQLQLQQTQQSAAGYRQAQQQHHYGSHGYPNFYQSQTEMSLERQQQNARDSTGSQAGQPSNQTQQLWQNSY